jgi:hypothetical protein
VDGQHVEGFETIAARRFEQGICLLPIQGGNLLALDLRGFGGIADVAGIRPSSTACLSALRSMLCILCTVAAERPESSFSR